MDDDSSYPHPSLDQDRVDDWSLHVWQLHLSSRAKLSRTFGVGQLRFVDAKHGSLGISRWQELDEYNKCNQELDSKTKENSHASIILPAIKDIPNEYDKWECSLSPNEFISSPSSMDILQHQAPSDDDLRQFSDLFSQEKENSEIAPESDFSEATTGEKTTFADQIQTNNFLCEPSNLSISNNFSSEPSFSFNGNHSLVGSKLSKGNKPQNSSNYTPPLMPFRPRQNFTPSTVSSRGISPMNQRHPTIRTDFNHSNYKPQRTVAPVQQSDNVCKYPWQRKNIPPVQASNTDGVKGFKTASHQLALNQQKQYNNKHQGADRNLQYGAGATRSLGARVSSVSSKFVPPIKRTDSDSDKSPKAYGDKNTEEQSPYEDLLGDPRLKNVDAKMVELIMNEVLDVGLNISWDDIAGLQDAKNTIQEVVVWPMLRPDIFTGLRGPPKGVLLFGPPGTGKTMIGKAIASQSGATFFSISASCLTSKWVGEGEKMVRALFGVARVKSPSVIFIDEIDSLLCQRSETEHESSRRLKTEFLVQLDGVGVLSEQVLVVGATNRPQELDEAARRRLVKRLYIPLPDVGARETLIERLLSRQEHSLTPGDILWIAENTEGYSGADVSSVCSEAAMGPIRGIAPHQMQSISLEQVRAISVADFRNSVASVRASVCKDDLMQYTVWNNKYGIVRNLQHTSS